MARLGTRRWVLDLLASSLTLFQAGRQASATSLFSVDACSSHLPLDLTSTACLATLCLLD